MRKKKDTPVYRRKNRQKRRSPKPYCVSDQFHLVRKLKRNLNNTPLEGSVQIAAILLGLIEDNRESSELTKTEEAVIQVVFEVLEKLYDSPLDIRETRLARFRKIVELTELLKKFIDVEKYQPVFQNHYDAHAKEILSNRTLIAALICLGNPKAENLNMEQIKNSIEAETKSGFPKIVGLAQEGFYGGKLIKVDDLLTTVYLPLDKGMEPVKKYLVIEPHGYWDSYEETLKRRKIVDAIHVVRQHDRSYREGNYSGLIWTDQIWIYFAPPKHLADTYRFIPENDGYSDKLLIFAGEKPEKGNTDVVKIINAIFGVRSSTLLMYNVLKEYNLLDVYDSIERRCVFMNGCSTGIYDRAWRAGTEDAYEAVQKQFDRKMAAQKKEYNILKDQNRNLTEKNHTLAEKNHTLAEKNHTLAEKNHTLAEKYNNLTEKNRKLSEDMRKAIRELYRQQVNIEVIATAMNMDVADIRSIVE